MLLAFFVVSVYTQKGQTNHQSKELDSHTTFKKFDHLVGLQSMVLLNAFLLKHSKNITDGILV